MHAKSMRLFAHLKFGRRARRRAHPPRQYASQLDPDWILAQSTLEVMYAHELYLRSMSCTGLSSN